MAGEHLLIVDDEDNLRSMLAAALRHNGFMVSRTSRVSLDGEVLVNKPYAHGTFSGS